MVTTAFAGTVAGATKSPAAVIEPEVEYHVTAELLLPVTAAVNCVAVDKAALAVPGETDTVICAGGANVTLIFTDCVVKLPGLGCVTATVKVPAAGKSPTAFSEVALT